MPRKTSAEKKTLVNNNLLSRIKWDDSYVSLSVGLIVVVIIALLGVVFFKGNRGVQDTSSTQFKPSIELEQSKDNEEAQEANAETVGSTYTVKAGDTLWSISEKVYKSGYNWVDIAKANNLTDPGNIFAGNKLKIPNVKAKEITVSETTTKVMTISGNTYAVQKGDDLWNISVRAYGDGYSWVKIAKANNLTNPDLIFSGNVLKIPR